MVSRFATSPSSRSAAANVTTDRQSIVARHHDREDFKLMLDDVFYLGDIYYFLKPGVGLVGIIEMIYSYITNTIIS